MRIAIVLLLALAAPLAAAQDSSPMTNADVVEMVEAGLSEDLIISTVGSSTAAFDTSASEIIALNSAGVPESVIQAMIDAGSASAGSERGQGAGGGFNPEEVILVDGENRTPMRYVTPQSRVKARALGFGGTASYASLPGPEAQLRITNREPSFIVAVPSNAQPESYFTLANFAVRRNDTREVATGGGFVSYSTGIARDRVMPTTPHELEDQSDAPENFVLYRVEVDEPLDRGEYAFILYNSQVRVVGYFGGGGDSYFDFGVDR